MKREFFVHKNESGIINKRTVREQFDALPTGKHLVTIEDKSRRTLSQNSYLHLMFGYVQKGLYDNGYSEIKTAEHAKMVCKDLFLSYEVENEITGAKIKLTKRTRDLTKSEMMIFIDEVIRWAAEYLSVVIPEPNQQTQLNF